MKKNNGRMEIKIVKNRSDSFSEREDRGSLMEKRDGYMVKNSKNRKMDKNNGILNFKGKTAGILGLLVLFSLFFVLPVRGVVVSWEDALEKAVPYSIKYIGDATGANQYKESDAYKVIDNLDTAFDADEGDSFGIYLENRMKIVKVVIDIQTLYGEGTVSFRYMNEGRLEEEGRAYSLVQGVNEIYVDGFSTSYLIADFEADALIEQVDAYGIPEERELKKLTTTMSISNDGNVTTNTRVIKDNDIETGYTLYNCLTTKQYYIEINALEDIDEIRYYGTVSADFDIYGKDAAGTYVLLIDTFLTDDFEQNRFNAIPILDKQGIDHLRDVKIVFKDYPNYSTFSIKELQIWGYGYREVNEIKGENGFITSGTSGQFDGFNLGFPDNFEYATLRITAATDADVFLNYVYIGNVSAGETKDIDVPSIYLREGFNLVEYYNFTEQVQVTGLDIIARHTGGKIPFFSNNTIINDHKYDSAVTLSNTYLLLNSRSDVSKIKIYGSAGTGTTQLSVYSNGDLQQTVTLSGSEFLSGCYEMEFSQTLEKCSFIKITGEMDVREIEVYGSPENSMFFKSDFDVTDSSITDLAQMLTDRLTTVQGYDLSTFSGTYPAFSDILLLGLELFIRTNPGFTYEQINDELKDILPDLPQTYWINTAINSFGENNFSLLSEYFDNNSGSYPGGQNPVANGYLTVQEDGYVKEDQRVITIKDPNQYFSYVEYAGTLYYVYNGAADIPVSLQDGSNDIVLEFRTSGGSAYSETISIEKVDPDLASSQIPYFSNVNELTYLVFPVTGNETYYQYYNGSVYLYTGDARGEYALDTLSSNLVDLYSYDKAGNRYRYTETVPADDQAPVISGIEYDNVWHNSSVSVTISAEDQGSGIASLIIYGGESICYSYTFSGETQINREIDIDYLDQGLNTLTLIITDRLGNSSEQTFTVLYDSISPVVLLPGESEKDIIVGENFVVNIKVHDYSISQILVNDIPIDLASCIVSGTVDPDGTIDGNGQMLDLEFNYNLSFGLEEQKAVNVEVSDKSGNAPNAESRTYVCDRTDPVISITNEKNIFNYTPITITGTIVEENLDKLSIKINDATVYTDITPQWNIDHWEFSYIYDFDPDNSENQTANFNIKALDKAGNTSNVDWTATYDTTPPEEVANLIVTYDGTVNKLTWNHIEGDTDYFEIEKTVIHYFETESPVEDASVIFTSTDLVYADSSSVEAMDGETLQVNKYVVYAIDEAGNRSEGVEEYNKIVQTVLETEDTVMVQEDTGTTVTVPAGAIEAGTVIAFSTSVDEETQQAVQLHFEPEGTEFDQFVAVKVDLEKLITEDLVKEYTEEEKDEIGLYYFDPATNSWELQFSYQDAEGNLIGLIQHFSDYSVNAPGFETQVREGIVSTNTYFKFNNEFVDESSGILYIDRLEETITASDDLYFELKGLFSSIPDDPDEGLKKPAQIGPYFSYNIPYIANGYLYLENGASYRLIWTGNECLYNKDIYFKGYVDEETKQIYIQFKDGRTYIFDAYNYYTKIPDHEIPDPERNIFTRIVNLVKSTATSRAVPVGTEFDITKSGDPALDIQALNSYFTSLASLADIETIINFNLYRKNVKAPLKEITDFDQTGKILFSYSGNDILITAQNKNTLGTLKTLYTYELQETSAGYAVIKTAGTLDREIARVEAESSGYNYIYTMEKGNREITVTVSKSSEDLDKLVKITIKNDEKGKTEYEFSYIDFSIYDSTEKIYRSVVRKKHTYEKKSTIPKLTVQFDYTMSQYNYNAAFIQCDMTFYENNQVIKTISKEFYDIFNKSTLKDNEGNPISEDIILKGKGKSWFIKTKKTELFSQNTEYIKTIEGDLTLETTDFISAFNNAFSEIPDNWSASDAGDKIIISRGILNIVQLYPDKIIYYNGITEVIYQFWNWVLGTSWTDKEKKQAIDLYSVNETIDGVNFDIRIILELIGDSVVLWKQLIPVVVEDDAGETYSLNYTGQITNSMSYQYNSDGTKVPVSDVHYKYDTEGNPVKITENDKITEYKWNVAESADTHHIFYYPEYITSRINGGNLIDVVAFDFDTTLGKISAQYDIGLVSSFDPDAMAGLKSNQETRKTSFEYYGYNGSLKKQINPEGAVTYLEYSDNGYFQPYKISYITESDKKISSTEASYNLLYNSIEEQKLLNRNDEILKTTSYDYDEFGDILRMYSDAEDFLVNGQVVSKTMATGYVFGANCVAVIDYSSTDVNSSSLSTLRANFKNSFDNDWDYDTYKAYFESFLNAEGNDEVLSFATLYSFDGLGHIDSIAQYTLIEGTWADKTISIQYDGTGQRTKITYPSGKILERTFDALGRVTSMILKKENSDLDLTLYNISYQWVLSDGEWLYETAYEQSPLYPDYDPEKTDDHKYTVIYTDIHGLEMKTELFYNSDKLISKKNEYSVDLFLEKESQLDKYDQTGSYATYEYDDFGQLSTVVLPESEYYEPYIDFENNELIYNVSAKSKVIQKTYTILGQLEKEYIDIAMDGADNIEIATTNEYNEFGLPVKQVLYDGSFMEKGYNEYFREISVKDVDGETQVVLYDEAGRVIAKRDKNKSSWIYYLYNIQGKIAAEIMNKGLEYTLFDAGNNPIEPYMEIDADYTGAGIYQSNSDFSITLASDWQDYAVFYEYDLLGRLVSKTDLKGNRVAYTYDEDGNPVSEKLYPGDGSLPNGIPTKTVVYDDLGNVSSVTDKNNVKAIYTYDTWGQTAEEEIVGNQNNTLPQKKYVYNEMGLVTDIFVYDPEFGTDEGFKTAYHAGYDSFGRKVTEIAEDGNTLTYVYNEDGSVKSVTYNEGVSGKEKTLVYGYDQLGNASYLNRFGIENFTVFSKLEDKFAYYSLFRFDPQTMVDSQGDTSQYKYNLTVMKNPKQVEYVKRADGVVIVPEVDFNFNENDELYINQVTHYFKDWSYYQTWKDTGSVPGVSSNYEFTSVKSNEFGLPVTINNDDQVTTEYLYNQYNEITEKKDTILGEAYSQSYLWDQLGILQYQSVVKTQDEINDLVPYQYIEWNYDENTKNVTGITGLIPDISYDEYGRVNILEYASSVTQYFEYDERSRIKKLSYEQENGGGGIDTVFSQDFTYNVQGKIAVIYEQGKVFADFAIRDSNGLYRQTKSFAYDEITGELISADLDLPVSHTATVNKDSGMKFITGDFYPGDDPLEAGNQDYSGGNINLGYDDSESETTPVGWGEEADPVNDGNWFLDTGENSLIFEVNSDNVKEVGYYLDFVQMASTYPGGSDALWDEMLNRFSDIDYSVRVENSNGWVELDAGDYALILEKGQLRVIFEEEQSDIYRVKVHYGTTVKSVFFEYRSESGEGVSDFMLQVKDASEALLLAKGTGYVTCSSHGAHTDYVYDLRGNLTRKEITYSNEQQDVYVYAYSEITNRLMSLSKLFKQNESVSDESAEVKETKLYFYDVLGNLVKQINSKVAGTQSITSNEDYAYNLKGRLAGFTVESSGITLASGEYLYDGMGNRVRSVTYVNHESNTNVNVYNLKNMPAYSKETSGSDTLEFYLLTLFLVPIVRIRKNDGETSGIETINSVDYDGSTIDVISGFNQSLSEYMYYDYLHSLRFVTDGTGALKAAYDYYPYGTPVYSMTNSDTDADPTFASHSQDEESGQYYAKQRYYDPETGRFNRLDPMQDNLNWYAYCGGDPVNNIDPWGLEQHAFDQSVKNIKLLTIEQQEARDRLWKKYAKILTDAGITFEEFNDMIIKGWFDVGDFDKALDIIEEKIKIIMDWAENHIDASDIGKTGFEWLCESSDNDGTSFFEYYMNQDINTLRTIAKKFDKTNVKIFVAKGDKYDPHFIANTELLIKILDLCIHFKANAIVWVDGYRSDYEQNDLLGYTWYTSLHQSNNAVDFAIGYCDTGNIKDVRRIRADVVATYAWSTGDFYEHELKSPSSGLLHLSINPYVDKDHDGKYDNNETKRKFWIDTSAHETAWESIWQAENKGVVYTNGRDFGTDNMRNNWFTNGGYNNFSGTWDIYYVLFGDFWKFYVLK